MKIVFTLEVVFTLFLLLAATAFAQNPSPVPPPPEVTVETLKVSLADLAIERDRLARYVQTLQAKILEQAAELQKLKDDLAKAQPKPLPTP